MNGEPSVRERIFVGRIKACISRQFREPLERAVHLLRGAFEQPPASHGEQCVADERDTLLIEDQRDVIERVAGDFDDLADVIAEADLATFGQRNVAPWNAAGARTRDACARRFLDREVPAGVIGVPVGVPDLRDGPAAPLRLREHRGCIAGIDHHGLSARLVVDEPDVVVAEGRDRDDLHAPPLRSALEDRQSIRREPARQLGGRRGCAQRSGLTRPHRSEAVLAFRFGCAANRCERSRCERIGRSLTTDCPKVVDETALQAAREAASHQVRKQRSALIEPPAMDVADPCFRRVEIGGAELNGAGVEGEGRGDAASVGDPAGCDDGDADCIGDLREERKETRRFGRIAAEESAGVAARLKSLRDDRVDAPLFEPDGFLDRGRIADDDRPRALTRSSSSSEGKPKWKLTTSGRSSSTTAQIAWSNGSRSAPPLPRVTPNSS